MFTQSHVSAGNTGKHVKSVNPDRSVCLRPHNHKAPYWPAAPLIWKPQAFYTFVCLSVCGCMCYSQAPEGISYVWVFAHTLDVFLFFSFWLCRYIILEPCTSPGNVDLLNIFKPVNIWSKLFFSLNAHKHVCLSSFISGVYPTVFPLDEHGWDLLWSL